jgi:hypothetical protein
MRALIILAMACGASAAQAENLHLVCDGGGSASTADFSSSSIHAANGAYVGSVDGMSFGHRGMSGEMEIELNGDTARVRVPRVFLPPAHGGSGGWFEVKQLSVTDKLITGKIRSTSSITRNCGSTA